MTYHAVDAVLTRATARPLAAQPPPWPDLDGNTSDDVERWRVRIGKVWADATAATIEIASPRLVEAAQGVLDDHAQRPPDSPASL